MRMTNGVPCPARKVWGGGESQAVSLKDIMAEEKQKELAVHTHQTHHSPPPHPHTSPRPLPASRQGSCDSAQSPPTNPWHAAQTAPAVSLRDLMAEETLRAERTRKKQPRSSLPSLSSHPHHPHTGHPSQRYIYTCVTIYVQLLKLSACNRTYLHIHATLTMLKFISTLFL